MTTTTVIYNHRGRASKDGLAPVEIRVIIERRAYYLNTGVKVKKSQFKFGMVVNHAQAVELNQRVAILLGRVEHELNVSIEHGCKVDITKLRKLVFHEKIFLEPSKAFLDWLDEQVPMLNIAPGTRKHYSTLLTVLHEYGKLEEWGDLTPEALYKFDSWLHQRTKPLSDADRKAKKKPEKIGDAGVYKYHKCLKAMLNRAVLFGELEANPYDKLRGQFRRGEKENVEYLTEEEMAAFLRLSPMSGTQMRVARDLFVVQMYSGLSFSDLLSFDFTKYKKVGEEYRYIGTRVKTGVSFVGQLLPPVVEVLERYNWHLPRLNNADYNHALKALGMAAGISTPLHSHLARHTFATYMLRNGVRIEHVSRMLGHTNITQTQRYAKVLAESLHEDFSRIARKMEANG